MIYTERLLKNFDCLFPLNFFLRLCYYLFGGRFYNKQQIEELRQKYINNPPEGMSKKDIKNMSDDDLLDMDYFLHEDDDIFNNLDDVDVVDFFLFYSFSRSFL